MRTIKVKKATRTWAGEKLEDTTLILEGAIDDDIAARGAMAHAEVVFDDEAKKIADALRYLPTGTRHRLLVIMLEQHAKTLTGTHIAPSWSPTAPIAKVEQCRVWSSEGPDPKDCIYAHGHVGAHSFEPQPGATVCSDLPPAERRYR